ncbi:putative RNA-binding protein 39 isoform X1 [Iris pallida]|uniref:RNA-binding protein 39 isoform X1 n=1 Tax=Iris pallida TaxID=29817 RepID=A0AAX6HBP0_IRIPA|nr:putative RNA-binding protein 39 isoform X1 [Iris pallida]
MDFDEYDYLEKAVEKKVSAKSNGAKSEEKKEGRRSSSKKHHRDDEPRDSNHHHRSKGMSRPEDERSRSSPRQRSPDRRPRDGEKDRPRDRHGRDMDRDERNGRDRGRMGEKVERESEREEIEGARRSRSRRDEEDREREEKERMEQPRERNRDGRRYKAKKEEAADPEADQERDQRTVFVYQICLKADERQVYEFFSSAGKVRDVRIIMDRNSGRSKGVGYVEFYDAMSVPMAISLSGQPLLGQAVMVKPSEAEKNLIQPTSAAVVAGGLTMPYSGGLRRLYVGNLHSNITEDQLRQVFEPFGALELVQLPLDPETGHCKGFGFIQFARLEDARNAQSLNGQLDIAGRTVKVSAVTDQEGVPDVGANAGDFDDDEGGGLALNAHSRALLMQKLDRSGTATSAGCGLLAPTASVFGSSVAASPLHPILPVLAGLQDPSKPVAALISPVETVGTPSECLWLKNMFDPSVETEPDFHLDIKQDVQDECSKFGTVKHIFVDKNSAGHVYLRFDSITSAMNAQRALHGRWFAGKMITTTFMVPLNYEGKFPSSS